MAPRKTSTAKSLLKPISKSLLSLTNIFKQIYQGENIEIRNFWRLFGSKKRLKMIVKLNFYSAIWLLWWNGWVGSGVHVYTT